MQDDNALGTFLKDRRTKLDPASLGYPMTRRRTSGLRREEVAQRANVSPTWYTWLEQGRGGVPSADVLDRLARGLALTEVEREHLFFLAQNRPPEVRVPGPGGVTPQLQRVLDALEFSPAFVRTSEWDLIAGNRAALALWDRAAAANEGRFNILERFFANPESRALAEWDAVARVVVASFRTETARAGFTPRARQLVDQLSRSSPDFLRIWNDRAVGQSVEGVKTFENWDQGPITFEYSSFAIEGNSGLRLVVFNPATVDDRARLIGLMAGRTEPPIR